MKTIPFLYQMAVTPPRNPDAWSMHDERARVIHQMLKFAGSKLQPLELLRLRGEIVKSTRTASLLNPTNTELHARLAERAPRSACIRTRSMKRQKPCDSTGSRPIATGSCPSDPEQSRSPDPDMERKRRQDADPEDAMKAQAVENL